jgi:hypothetical protein
MSSWYDPRAGQDRRDAGGAQPLQTPMAADPTGALIAYGGIGLGLMLVALLVGAGISYVTGARLAWLWAGLAGFALGLLTAGCILWRNNG